MFREAKVGVCNCQLQHVCQLLPKWRRLKCLLVQIYRYCRILLPKIVKYTFGLASTFSSDFITFVCNWLVGEPKFAFEAKDIQRMELLVLSTLRWKMQASTPFSFLDYFLRKITCDQVIVKSSILRSVGPILNIIKCIYSLYSVSVFSLYTMFLRNNVVLVGKSIQVSISWNSGPLKLLQQWQFLYQGKCKQKRLTRP